MRYLLLSITLFLTSIFTEAQDSCVDWVDSANSLYNKGSYSTLTTEFESNYSSCLEKSEISEARLNVLYRLLSLSYMKQDNEEKAQLYLDKLFQSAQKGHESAEVNQRIAENLHENAQDQLNKAKKHQFIALGKTLALKSLDHNGQAFNEIKSLLAQQAYTYHTRWDGYEYDNDIFSGMYFALKSFDDEITTTFRDAYSAPGDILMVSDPTDRGFFSVHENGSIVHWKDDCKEELAKSIKFTTIKAFAISQNGNVLAIGGINNSDGYLKLIDTYNAFEEILVPGLGGGVIDISFDSNHRVYFLDNYGHSIKRYYQGKTEELIEPGRQFYSKLTHLQVSPSDMELYLTSVDGEVFKFDLLDNSVDIIYRPSEPESIANRIEALALSTDKGVAIGTAKGVIHLVKDQNIKTFVGPTAAIGSIAFSSDGKLMAAASMDKRVFLWNLDDPDQIPIRLSDHNGGVSGLLFSDENNVIIAGTDKREIKFWPTRPNQMSDLLCKYTSRDMTSEEWERYVGNFPFESTCNPKHESKSIDGN